MPYPKLIEKKNQVFKISFSLLPDSFHEAVVYTALLSPAHAFRACKTLHVTPCVRVGRRGKFGLNIYTVGHLISLFFSHAQCK